MENVEQPFWSNSEPPGYGLKQRQLDFPVKDPIKKVDVRQVPIQDQDEEELEVLRGDLQKIDYNYPSPQEEEVLQSIVDSYKPYILRAIQPMIKNPQVITSDYLEKTVGDFTESIISKEQVTKPVSRAIIYHAVYEIVTVAMGRDDFDFEDIEV